jgi:hypothetical protein
VTDGDASDHDWLADLGHGWMNAVRAHIFLAFAFTT